MGHIDQKFFQDWLEHQKIFILVTNFTMIGTLIVTNVAPSLSSARHPTCPVAYCVDSVHARVDHVTRDVVPASCRRAKQPPKHLTHV